MEILTQEELEDSSDDEDTTAQPSQPSAGGPIWVVKKSAQHATDDDAETAEDAGAADALTIFLDGTQPHLASSHQLLHLAQNIVPHSWGCIKFDLSKPLLNLMSTLFARSVLLQSRDPRIACVPELGDLERWYLQFLANIFASTILPLQGLKTLQNFKPLLDSLVSPDFWYIQLRYALYKGAESSLPQHRLLRLIPLRGHIHRGTPPFFQFDSHERFFRTDCVMIFLPIQLCLWIAGSMKSLIPDPKDSSTDTPELELDLTDALARRGPVSLASHIPMKGTKRAAPGSAPKAHVADWPTHKDEQPLSGPKEDDKPKILRRILKFKGPALLRIEGSSEPCFPFNLSPPQKDFLKTWAEEKADSSSGSIRSAMLTNSFDPCRDLSIAVIFSKVPSFSVAREDTAPATQGSLDHKTVPDAAVKKEAKGHGDLADLSKLSKVFGSDDIGQRLDTPCQNFMLLDGLNRVITDHIFSFVRRGAPPVLQYVPKKQQSSGDWEDRQTENDTGRGKDKGSASSRSGTSRTRASSRPAPPRTAFSSQSHQQETSYHTSQPIGASTSSPSWDNTSSGWSSNWDSRRWSDSSSSWKSSSWSDWNQEKWKR